MSPGRAHEQGVDAVGFLARVLEKPGTFGPPHADDTRVGDDADDAADPDGITIRREALDERFVGDDNGPFFREVGG